MASSTTFLSPQFPMSDNHRQETLGEGLRPGPIPRIASSTSTRALQEMYRQSQGAAFFAQTLPHQRPPLSPTLSYATSASRRSVMSFTSMSEEASGLTVPINGMNSPSQHPRARSRLGSRVFEQPSGKSASQSARPLSTFGDRPAAYSTPSFDRDPTSIAGLDLTDPWGYSFTSASPYDALLPPPLPSSRLSVFSNSPLGSSSNLAGSSGSTSPSLRSVSPLPWSDRTFPSSPATSIAPSAQSISSAPRFQSSTTDKRRSKSCNGLDLMSEPIAQQASPLGPSPSQARPSQGRQRAMSLHGSVAPVMSKANKKSKMDQAVAAADTLTSKHTRTKSKSKLFAWFGRSKSPSTPPIETMPKRPKIDHDDSREFTQEGSDLLTTPDLTHSSASSAVSSSVYTPNTQSVVSLVPDSPPKPLRTGLSDHPEHSQSVSSIRKVGQKASKTSLIEADSQSSLSNSSHTVRESSSMPVPQSPLRDLPQRRSSFRAQTDEASAVEPRPQLLRPKMRHSASSLFRRQTSSPELPPVPNSPSTSPKSQLEEQIAKDAKPSKNKNRLSISFKSVRRKQWSDLPPSPASSIPSPDAETAQLVDPSISSPPLPAAASFALIENPHLPTDSTSTSSSAPEEQEGLKVHVSKPSQHDKPSAPDMDRNDEAMAQYVEAPSRALLNLPSTLLQATTTSASPKRALPALPDETQSIENSSQLDQPASKRASLVDGAEPKRPNSVLQSPARNSLLPPLSSSISSSDIADSDRPLSGMSVYHDAIGLGDLTLTTSVSSSSIVDQSESGVEDQPEASDLPAAVPLPPSTSNHNFLCISSSDNSLIDKALFTPPSAFISHSTKRISILGQGLPQVVEREEPRQRVVSTETISSGYSYTGSLPDDFAAHA